MAKISIIITSYRRKDFIQNLLDSIYRNTRYPNYEIIVVNTDPSTNKRKDEFLRMAEKHNKIKLVDTGKHYQYTEALQQGYEVATGEYIQLLNDDCLIPKSEPLWLNHLFTYTQGHPKAGTTSCYQYLGNMRLYTKGEFDITRPGHTHSTRCNINDLPKVVYPLWNTFSCVLMRKSFVDENQFIDVIPPGHYHYGSDSTYCRRVLDKGFRNILLNRCWIYHFNNREIKFRMGNYVYTGE